MTRLKYLVLFLASCMIFQLADFAAVKLGIFTVNNKAVFGFAANNFLAFIISIIFLMILFLLARKTNLLIFFFCLIAGASISNLVDRIIYGGVIDYFEFWFLPVFNFADLVIVIFMTLFFFKKTFSQLGGE